MPTVHLFIERQCDLVVCRIKSTDNWFFTACYRGMVELLGIEFPKGSKFELDVTASNIKQLEEVKSNGTEGRESIG